jgi:hypothetical protein
MIFYCAMRRVAHGILHLYGARFLLQITGAFHIADFCAMLLRLKRMSETTASVPFDADQAVLC